MKSLRMVPWLGSVVILFAVASAIEDDDPILRPPANMDPRTILPVTTREQRFPSREERVRLYMSNWYNPPCSDTDQATYRYVNASALQVFSSADYQGSHLDISPSIVMNNSIVPDTTFFVNETYMRDCLLDEESAKHPDSVLFRKNMQMYCIDAATTLMTAVAHTRTEAPILVQFGDLKHSHLFKYIHVPVIKKFRSSATGPLVEKSCPRKTLQSAHGDEEFQPIVWKFASRRHFANLNKIYTEDTSWDQKLNSAVFRGQLTGSRDGFDKHKTPHENCMNLRRCRIVYMHGDSPLIDARLTSTRNRLPRVLNGVNLMASSVALRRLLVHKGIVMLEGNDVASGLKWALLSQSVVLMPIPKHTSWAMEELLEPWVHYIPLNENATDVEEKMQWVVDNDDLARAIAERSSLWMEDMVFHPDASEDDRWIQEEIIRRYSSHFQPIESIDTQ